MLRHYIINNFNVTEIISVSPDQFENTTTKTSIIIFHNTGKTERIQFSELLVTREQETVFNYSMDKLGTEIYKMENDIIDVNKKITCYADYKDISKIKLTFNKDNKPKFEMDYSLNYKDYMIHKVECKEDYKIVKLGELIEYKPKTKHGSQEGSENGLYKYYTSSQKIKYSDYLDIQDELCIIIGTGGAGSLYIDTTFGMSQHMFAFNNKIKEITLYLYYYLKYNWNRLYEECFNGSTLKCLNKTNLNNYEIAIPINIDTIKPELENLYSLHNRINEITNTVSLKEFIIQNKINELIENNEYDELELKDICEINDKKIKRYDTSYSKNIGQYKFHTGATDGKYYCDDYNIDKYTIIINKTNGSGKCNIFLDKYITCAKQTFIIQSSNNEIETQYIYYYLCNNIINLEKGYNGACHKNLSFEFLKKFKINIPKDKTIIENLEIYFQEIEKLKLELENIKLEYKNNLDRLF
jgi:restriction endonuclease S subunit